MPLTDALAPEEDLTEMEEPEEYSPPEDDTPEYLRDYMQPTDAVPPPHGSAKFVKYNEDGSALFDNGASLQKDGGIRWEDKDTGMIFYQRNPYVKAVSMGKKLKKEPTLEERAEQKAADKGILLKPNATEAERSEYEKTRIQALNPKLPGTGANAGQAYAAERATRVLQSVDELEKKVTWRTTGLGSLSDVIPATDAKDFKAELDTLKANIAFGELTEMRNASKTGGALGQVSNVELGLLESTLGALDTRQSSENFRKQLAKVKASIQRWNEAKKLNSAQPNSAPSVPTANPLATPDAAAIKEAYRSGKMTKEEARAALQALGQ